MASEDRNSEKAHQDDAVDVLESSRAFEMMPSATRESECLRRADEGLPSMSRPARVTSSEENGGDVDPRPSMNGDDGTKSYDPEQPLSVEGIYSALRQKDEEIAELKRNYQEMQALLDSIGQGSTSPSNSRRKSIDPLGSPFDDSKQNHTSGRSDDPEQVALRNAQIEARNKGYRDNPFQRFLSRDTFSIMIFSSPRTPMFWWCMAIFTIQILTFSLVAANIIDLSRAHNPLGIPPNVEFPVRITQLIAIIISVATQEDIRTALNMAYDGYSHQVFSVFEGSQYGLWLLSIACRFFEGALGLIVTFMLVMREEEVIELLLNFTAMEFVSQLDEVAFYLSRQGFVGKRNQLQAETVLTTIYYIRKPTRRALRIFFLLAILTSMLVGWVVVVRKQQGGVFLCATVFVQFSDEFVPALGTFSGVYRREDTSMGLRSSRPIYLEERSTQGQGCFAYCNDEEAWTFGWESREDPCASWVAISETSSSFDLIEAGQLQWFVMSENFAGMVPLQYFQMFCYDCEGPGMDENMVCGGRGTCMNNLCDCDDDAFGLQCEFTAPCESLSIDERFGGFLGTRDWSDEFTALKDDNGNILEVYGRPVYINEIEGDRPGTYDVVLFTGRRWIVTYSFIMTGLKGEGLDNLIEFLDDFHGHFSDFQSAFISGPVDVGRPSNAATPIGQDWFRPNPKRPGPEVQSANENFPLDVTLFCGECSTAQPCSFNSTCLENGVCECTTGARGIQCQIAPVNNGQCNEFFNSPEFGFDGGDCCGSTCVSSDNYFCGKDPSGFIDIGYPACLEPANTWRVSGDRIRSDIGRFGLAGRAVSLSSNGAVLAVGEPGYDVVRVFDKDGSKWIQRGRTLEGPDETFFGSRLAMSASMMPAVRNPLSANSFTLAASGTDETRFFRCRPTGCKSSGSLPGSAPFALSDDGQYALHQIDGESTMIQAYRIRRDRFDERGRPIEVPLYEFRRKLAISMNGEAGRYLCLSGNGGSAAIGSILYSIVQDNQGDSISDADLTVRLYDYSRDREIWSETGVFRSASHRYGTGLDSFPLQSVALSTDGNVLAIASFFDADSSEGVSGVQVYTRARENGSWIERGPLIRGADDGTTFAWGVDLSSDGSTLVVAGNGESQVSMVRTFSWNGQMYEQIFNDIPAGGETAVAVAADGLSVAVGLPLSSGGEAFVYRTNTVCPADSKSFRVSVTTDASSDETRWEAVDSSGNVLLRGGEYGDDREFTTFVDHACVNLDTECITFTIYDDGKADGITSPGGYGIIIDGEVVFQGGNFGASERTTYGNCPSLCSDEESHLRLEIHAVFELEQVVWVVEDAEGKILLEGGQYGVKSSLEDLCVPTSECLRFSATGGGCLSILIGETVVNYVLNVDGTVRAEDSFIIRCDSRVEIGDCPPLPSIDPLECEEGFELLRVEAFFFTAPLPEATWSIGQTCDPSVVLEGKSFKPTDFERTLVEQTCIPQGLECLTFFGEASRGGGFTIQRGDAIVLDVDSFSEFEPILVLLDETEDCLCPGFLPEPELETPPPGFAETFTAPPLGAGTQNPTAAPAGENGPLGSNGPAALP